MLKKNTSFNVIALTVGLLGAHSAHAQFEPAIVPVGGLGLMPTLNLQVRQDDNILSAENNPTSSIVSIVTPSLVLGMDDKVNNFSVSYLGNYGFYTESSDDNYLDHRATLDVHHELTPFFALDLDGQYDKTHEERGSGYSFGAGSSLTEPDRYTITGGGLGMTYGTRRSKGQLALAGDANILTFDTRRSITEVRDRNNIGGRGTFYLNLSGVSSFLMEANFRTIDYKNDLATSLDSTEQQYYAGVSWNVTDLTEGVVKLGWQIKDFTDDAREDFAGFSWEAGINWTPMATTIVNLSSEGRTAETNGFGEYIDSKGASVTIAHDLSDLLVARLEGDLTYNDYQPHPAEEGIVTAGIGVDYSVRRWLSTGLGYTYSTRRSNQAGLDYTRNIFLLNIQASM